MRKLTRVTSVAAPMPASDIDTDLIFPARFLLLPDRHGLGKQLFHDLRSVKAKAPFVLDTKPYDTAQIIIAGTRFGTGSSREHAVWALEDFGIRCVIAPMFGEIFQVNCIKNGILPIVLNALEHERLMAAAQRGDRMTVDLERQEISLTNGKMIAFAVDEQDRQALLNGIDEIDAMLAGDVVDVTDFEVRQRAITPWLYLTEEQLAPFRFDVDNKDAPL